jgi:uncharacterized membrane protein YqiK
MDLLVTRPLLFLLIFAGFIFVFLIFRAIVLWYFQITKRVEQNDEIIRLLKKLNGEEPENTEPTKVISPDGGISSRYEHFSGK